MAATGTFTYDPTEPDESVLFEVRTRTGDTDEDDPLLWDEQILWLVAAEGGENTNIQLIVIRAIDLILARLSREADTSGSLTASQARSQRITQYERLQERLRRDLGRRPVPRLSNDTKDKIRTLDENETLVQPSFKIGMDDNRDRRRVRNRFGADDCG